ncbi:carbon-nitrogen hydrolase family protein [Suttonella sp. R2A3]|uniref:carbon-nitrogen hydrolase family protein n=1 Tax=Suttonella sp. R2A3 TaxID=2908648 RepID=UPI001F1EA650|nr:carbon-nitrogen hydrolase family protein [Suttonella sp. R2A3]UJF24970.1 carbon-nitrogen hydrolase family protein [Suttonella sp. R2A3]
MPSLNVAGIQFAPSSNWSLNLTTSEQAIRRAAARDAKLIVLPESSLYTREPGDQTLYAQPLDGPFVQALSTLSEELSITIVAGMSEPATDSRVYNTTVVLADGALQHHYRKLHLYDAFSYRESDEFVAGDELPPIFEVSGLHCGLMTCYDLRFPELARLLAERGADVIIVPTAWFAGPLKEWHWQVLCAARAIENGVYLVAIDSCSTRRIGMSRVVDPYGVAIAQLGAQPGELYATLESECLVQARTQMPMLSQRRFRIDPQVRTFEDG